MPHRLLGPFITLLLLSTIGLSDAVARIKLITLPVRERVEIQLDHPTVTLVEEERIVPLVQGINQVDFSWANTRIDPDTIIFRVLPGAATAAVEVLSVSYPPNENALLWSVSTATSGPARVRISYVLDGLNKRFHYRALAANDESSLTLSQFIRIENSANEAFADSQVWAGFGDQLQKPIGLNETKEVLIAKYLDVPVRKTYTADLVEHGYLDAAQNKLNIPMHYVLTNNAANGLGTAPLPFGKVRIFQRDSQGSSAFIGEDWGEFTPLDDELALFLGLAKDIAVKRTIERNDRQRIAGNLYRYDITLRYEIENFKYQATTLTLVERPRQVRDSVRGQKPHSPQWSLGPDTTLSAQPDESKSDYEKLLFDVSLPARNSESEAEKLVHLLHLIFDNEW